MPNPQFDLYFESMAGGQTDAAPDPTARMCDFSEIWRRSCSFIVLSIAGMGSTNILVVVAERLEQQQTLWFLQE
jgi:hypothetical protein